MADIVRPARLDDATDILRADGFGPDRRFEVLVAETDGHIRMELSMQPDHKVPWPSVLCNPEYTGRCTGGDETLGPSVHLLIGGGTNARINVGREWSTTETQQLLQNLGLAFGAPFLFSFGNQVGRLPLDLFGFLTDPFDLLKLAGHLLLYPVMLLLQETLCADPHIPSFLIVQLRFPVHAARLAIARAWTMAGSATSTGG
ncbi:MAG: hypothetical protein FD153_881 [Rhodospirillaceae bacterium]|nr:MAG: hypothetical protein FD153_881 [Rhodospirillaceae bacterium]